MIIEVLVCRPDGTQEFERREVADNYFTLDEETSHLEGSPQGAESTQSTAK